MERVAPGAKRFTLGARERRGLVALDPRAILGVLAAASAVAFMSKSPAVELALVASVALLQALCGHVRMALGYLGCYGALWAILTFVFPNVGGIAATMFTISLTFSRKVFLCLMAGSLLVAECSVHRLCAALARLRVPQVVLVPLTVTMRYFPTLADEASHIRDAMRLRDIPASARMECFVVPLVMSAIMRCLSGCRWASGSSINSAVLLKSTFLTICSMGASSRMDAAAAEIGSSVPSV